jgi:hypothetical protein
MKFVITLNQGEFKLEIRQKGRVLDPHAKRGSAPKARGFNNPRYGVGVDSETSLYYHDLSDVLITSLDKLLKRNNIDTTALKSFKIRGNTGKNSASYKIAAAFIEGLKTFMK